MRLSLGHAGSRTGRGVLGNWPRGVFGYARKYVTRERRRSRNKDIDNVQGIQIKRYGKDRLAMPTPGQQLSQRNQV